MIIQEPIRKQLESALCKYRISQNLKFHFHHICVDYSLYLISQNYFIQYSLWILNFNQYLFFDPIAILIFLPHKALLISDAQINVHITLHIIVQQKLIYEQGLFVWGIWSIRKLVRKVINCCTLIDTSFF